MLRPIPLQCGVCGCVDNPQIIAFLSGRPVYFEILIRTPGLRIRLRPGASFDHRPLGEPSRWSNSDIQE
jgi:hypothetical protein